MNRVGVGVAGALNGPFDRLRAPSAEWTGWVRVPQKGPFNFLARIGGSLVQGRAAVERIRHK